MGRLAATAALTFLLLVAPAGAATITGTSSTVPGNKGPDYPVFDLSVSGSPGEQSALTLTVTNSGSTHVEASDAAAPLTAAGACTQTGPSSVTCHGAGAVRYVNVELGDGDDKLVLAMPSSQGSVASVNAGPGDDDISGGPGSDSIDGGGGRDTLRGGPGVDSFTDGDAPGAADADVIDGGPGTDDVAYDTRTANLAFDMAAGRAGEAGEGDQLTSVESVVGGAGSDVFTGTAAAEGYSGGPGPDVAIGGGGADSISLGGGGRADAGPGNDSIECGRACTIEAGEGKDDLRGSDDADRLHGGPGRDELLGFKGDDDLEGGPGNDSLGGGYAEGVRIRDGRDRLSGGPGNDRLIDSTQPDRYDGGSGRDLILALDRRAERVRCGPGRDRLVGDRRERATGCERRDVGAHVRLAGERKLDRGDGVLTVELECPEYALGGCRGRLEARAGSVLVGRGRYSGGNSGFGDITLNAAGRALRRGARVTVIARGGDATGGRHVTRRRYRAG